MSHIRFPNVELNVSTGELTPREVSGEAAPRCNRCGWPLKERVEDGCVEGNCSQRPLPAKDFAAELQESSMQQWFDAHPAAPTPHSDSLDLEAIRAVLDGTTADTVDRGGILWLLSTCAALLSRLETLTRERGAYPEVLADNEKLTVENESLYRRFDKLESENVALLSCLETLTRERDEAEAQAKRFYAGSERLSDALSVAESENARMTEVVEAARSLVNGYNSKRNQSRAGTVAQLRAYLADFDAARAAL